MNISDRLRTESPTESMVKRIKTDISTKLRDASIHIIKANQSESGAYMASPNFRVYKYSWFRDGAFIAEAMSANDETESALLFHKWATRIIIEREGKIASLIRRYRLGEEIGLEEHLHCRFTLEGEESEEVWTNLQLDGFGTWLWSLGIFRERGNVLPLATYRAVDNLIGYLGAFWNLDTYDWWEESFGHQHVANLGSIAAGLKSCSTWEELSPESRSDAARNSRQIEELIHTGGLINGRLAKWIGGDGLDSSLLSLIAPFRLFSGSDRISEKTISSVIDELGMLGTYRHKEDSYFGGGRWPLLSCFLGLALIEAGDCEKAVEILNWVETLANGEFELPEQLEAPLLHPELRAEWIHNWGEPAIPLLWSHAMYLSLSAALSSSKEME